MIRRVGLAVVALALASGCVSAGSVQTADTLGRGNFQFAVEPGVWGAGVVEEDVDGIGLPHVDFAARVGVADSVDIGVRVGSSLLEFQTKFLLTDVNHPGLAISLAPSVGGVFASSEADDVGGFAHIQLPLLIGLKTSGGSEFVLGPRVTNTTLFATSGGDGGVVNVVSVGSSIGYAARLSRNFRLMPEVAVLVPLAGTLTLNGRSGNATASFTGGIVQFKLGLLFGTGRRAPVMLPAVEESY